MISLWDGMGMKKAGYGAAERKSEEYMFGSRDGRKRDRTKACMRGHRGIHRVQGVGADDLT